MGARTHTETQGYDSECLCGLPMHVHMHDQHKQEHYYLTQPGAPVTRTRVVWPSTHEVSYSLLAVPANRQ